MNTTVAFRPYTHADREACLQLFDENCPEFFAPNERNDYACFLDAGPEGYEACIVDNRIAGAFGLIAGSARRMHLNWILIDPKFQGMGIGSAIMDRIATLAMAAGIHVVDIAASHKSAPFFAKFGAAATVTTHDGWGPGMHRVDMELRTSKPEGSLEPTPVRDRLD
jgi:GNAT superfamily N-acetyltransferase